jgi:hypothetical protein
MQSDSDILHYTARSLSNGSLASGVSAGIGVGNNDKFKIDYDGGDRGGGGQNKISANNNTIDNDNDVKNQQKQSSSSNFKRLLFNSPLANKAAAEVKPIELKYKHYKSMLCYEIGTFCCFLKFLVCGSWHFYSMRTYMIILGVMVLSSSMIIGLLSCLTFNFRYFFLFSHRHDCF